jgi:hypothetical protein
MTKDQRIAEAVADKLLGMKRYQCDECDYSTDDAEDLDELSNLYERVPAGCIMPAGECPECGASIYSDLDVVENGNLVYFAQLLRQYGYAVTAPSE